MELTAGAIVPELNKNNFGKSSIRQLLTMSSGAYLAKIEGRPEFLGGLGRRPNDGKPYKGMFWPIRIGQVTIPDVLWGSGWDKIKNKDIHPPGEAFHYKSGDTLSLSMVIERVTGRSLANYFDQAIWRLVRSAGGAHWEADRTGSTITASGFQARLVDWGRLALWILNELKKPGCFGDYLRAATSKQIDTAGPDGCQKGVFRGYGYNGGPTICSRQDFGGLDLPARYSGLIPKAKKL